MSLLQYKRKRNFEATTEPEGKRKSSEKELIFVVQQHDATRLHYDFRLEAEGVLKSWAVPKGPSLNPEDKRLAMMVEDHPYSYKDFEGTIPEGNYGAGNVIVWDKGTYHEIHATNRKESEKNILAGIKKGHISFILKGKKLKGEFSLIKLKGKDENAWLLIKKGDKYAAKEDVLEKDRSVISKKKLLLRLRGKTNGKAPVAKKKREVSKKPKIDPTEFSPMLATLGDAPFDKTDWVFEIKYDGYRTVALVGDEVQLFSRNNFSFNAMFAPLVEELKKIKHHAVLDGEVVLENEKGVSNFQLLQNYRRTLTGNLKFYVFDLMALEGRDVRNLSLIERKELLKMLLGNYKLDHVHYSDHVNEKGKAFYDAAVKKGLEGIIAKDANSKYLSGYRTRSWLKIKISQQEEAIIAGMTMPRGSRSMFGSLILGAYKKGELRYIGNCGTGFNEQTLKEVYNKLKPLFTDTSPFSQVVKHREKIQWVKPKLVCQVKFSEWTEGGIMRHPVFMGLRIDKKSKDVMAPVKKQVPKKTAKSKATLNGEAELNGASTELLKKEKAYDLKVGKVVLHLTNQNKIYFPDDKISKGDLVNYYNEISELILPYLKDRPQSMNRFPNGIKGPSFYQKDIDVAKSPSWLNTEKIYSTSNKEYIDYLICNDKATLLYMANLGCIDINPWNSRIGSPENPDWAVIDLDPEKIAFKEVTKVALIVKDIMDELETECYCKTSGATGLHIFIPLAAKYDYDIVKTFSEVIAQTVFSRSPENTSIERSPKKRQKKVYIDFLQNRRGQTLAAPYSVRPKAGATVSTPLEWKEVNAKLDPSNFTIKNILKRINKKGDLWKPVIGKGAALDKLIRRLYELSS